MSQPKVHAVSKAAKDYPQHEIAKGEPYYWWKAHMHAPKCYSKTPPRPSQLETTKLSGAYAAREAIEATQASIGKQAAITKDDLKALAETIKENADQVREVAEEYRSSAETIRESFSESPTADDCDEKADGLEANADEWESAADDFESRVDDIEDGGDDAEEELANLAQEMIDWEPELEY